MTPEEVEAAVGRAIDNKLGQFYIDRETHYQDHQFISELRKWSEEAKGTVLRAVLKFITYGLIGLLIIGFIVWGKEHFGK
jgi:hypothetical protein